jgi:hypothetical protein
LEESSVAEPIPISTPGVEHALNTIDFLFQPGDAIEIRALKVRGSNGYRTNQSGYFNVENRKAIADAVRAVDGRADGVYICLNKLAPALLARSENHLSVLDQTTKDVDVVERRWFYIDVDPIRPAGISSSDKEHRAALEKAKAIRDSLTERGWPVPLYADSGNGAHLLYRLPEGMTASEATEIIKNCLVALAARFNDDSIKIDESVFNASRICKLYGTLACKGDNTQERPHRRSEALEGPEERFEPVAIDLLKQLAAEATKQARPATPSQNGHQRFSVENWLRRNGLEIRNGPEPYKDGSRWILARCPFNPEHTGTSAAVFEDADGKLGFKCQHDSCRDKNGRSLLDLIEPDRQHAAPEPDSKIRRIEDLPRVEDIAAAEVEWDVEGIVPSGTLVMITGEPGAGKSTLASALGWAVSRGGEFLGRPTKKRPVLILDAENPHPAVVERFARLGITSDERFHTWGQWSGEDPPAAGGAIVLEWIARCDPRPIVIVDSFVRFHPGTENDAGETSRYMSQYRKLTASGTTVILLHHPGKSETSQDYRGSSDIKAAVDVAYKLTDLGDGTRLSLLELRAFKQRITVMPRLYLRYQDGKFNIDEYEASKTVTEQLVELLKENPGINTRQFRDLAGQHGLGRNRGYEFLTNGVANNSVRIEKQGRTSRHFWVGESVENP